VVDERSGDEVVAAQFRAMGTDVTVLALAGDAAGDVAGGGADLGAVAADAIEALEAKWSRFRPTSELCRVNDAAGAPVVVSPETYDLVARAVDAWRFTGGRYDPTILPALIAAGYDRSFDELAADDRAPAGDPVPAPGCAGVVLDAIVHAIRLPEGVAFDLGGIGKGYAADLVARDLASGDDWRGVLVNLGGDLRAMGESPAPHGWVIEVDDPLDTGATGLLSLATGAVATSTRLRRAWTRAGRAMHHLVDPRTGLPGGSGVASVTVIAGDAWRAEVLAKAAFLAGPVDGGQLVTDAGATGLVVTDDGSVLELDGLSAFRV
jgi:thiamine biosynthesis lipoprotein